METPVLFLSPNQEEDPVTTQKEIPKLRNSLEIGLGKRTFYVTEQGYYLEQGCLGYGCSLYAYDFYNTKPLTWFPVSIEPRVVLVMMLNADVPCELKGYGKIRLRESFMYLMYLPPGVKHVANFLSSHTQVIHINFEQKVLEGLADDLQWAKTLLNIIAASAEKGVFDSEARIAPEIYVQLNKIFNYKDNEKNFRLFLRTRVLDILHEYIKELEGANTNKENGSYKSYTFYEKVLLARNIIDANNSEKISVFDMARNIGLSRFSLQKGFNEVFQTTYDKYQVESMMNKAAQILISYNVPISDIARQFGYDESSFGKTFKKRHKLTPLKYRNKFKIF